MKENISKKGFVNKDNLVYFAVSAGIGLIYGSIGELFLFNLFTEKIYTPIGIALYFLIFGLIIVCINSFIAFFRMDQSSKANAQNRNDTYKVVAIAMAVLFVFSALFEFLYELGKQALPVPTSYIFLIDDSDSMSGTEQIRTDAIRDIMTNSKNDIPYAVYKFSTSAQALKTMAKYKSGDESSIVFMSDGGTDILGGVRFVLDDIENNRLDAAGNYPRIVLLSDGASSSAGMRSVAKECIDNGVAISSVGTGYCDEAYLQKLANLTGGSYVYSTDASNLADSMEQAISQNASRNLLSSRFVSKADGLYCFLRLLFLTLLSLVWTFIKVYSGQNERSIDRKNFSISLAGCLAGTLCIEFMSQTAFNIHVLRILFCVFWAFMIGELIKKTGITKVDLSVSNSGENVTNTANEYISKIDEDEQKDKGRYKIDLSRTFDSFKSSQESSSLGTTQSDDFFGSNEHSNSFDDTGAFGNNNAFGDSSPFDDFDFSDATDAFGKEK